MNIFTTIILCCFCTFLLLSASAQSADSTHRPNDSTYHLLFATTGSLNKTNEGDAYLLSNNANLNVNTRRSTLTANANWIYGQLDKTLTNNDFTATANMDFLKKVSKLYYWALLNYQTSYSLKTIYRFQPGVGLGYGFVNTSDAAFSVSDGILFEMANLTDATFGKEKYQTFRNSLRIKYHFVFGKIVSLDGIDFWQPSLVDFKDYNLQFNNSISLKIKQWLNLTSALSYNKISRTGSEALLLTFGITLDKYF